jgi:NAD(P)-dependent dehydrogenase (short-subunit alcohol dehydrogenase family)
LGQAIALLFAREGADVGVLGISLRGAHDAAARIAALGRRGVAVAGFEAKSDLYAVMASLL